MKITLTHNAVRQVKQLAPWSGTRLGLPHLEHLLLQANGAVTAAACSLAAAVEVVLPAGVEEEGSALLPPRFLEALSGEETVEIAASAKKLTLRAGSNTTTLKCDLDPAEFPFPDAPADPLVLGEVPAGALRDALVHVRGVPDATGGRSTWSQVLWLVARPGALTIAAADGVQLAVRVLAPIDGPAREADLLVGLPFGRLAGFLADLETVHLSCTERFLFLEGRPGGFKASVSLQEGRLPDYQAIVPPKEGAVDISLPAGELRRALEVVGSFSLLGEIVAQDGCLTLTTNGDEGAGRAECAATISGNVTVCLNVPRLRQVLAGIADAATIRMYVARPDRPVLFEVMGGGDETCPGYDVLMPMVK
jgi:hypothetical protein